MPDSTSRLRRAHDEVGRVLGVQRFGEIVELTVELPRLAGSVQPGEFAQIRCGSAGVPILRRPFSIAAVSGDACSFVFEAVGQGTRLLAQLRRDDRVCALGPLGRGFDVAGVEGHVVCVAGGVGCAPFPLLIERLVTAGVADITVINGAATASRLYPAERFARNATAIEVIALTEDGTAGRRGRVTDVLEAALDRRPAALYACGPNAMLAAVHQRLRSHPAAATLRIVEASLEAPMGCGFGTCLGCAVPVGEDGDRRWALCCTDGPVFAPQEVAWDALLAQVPVP